MDRLQEVAHKHEQLKQIMAAHNIDALLLRRTRNIAWFTAGADASIPLDFETGMYSILVTADARTILTDNIEATRLRGEERFEDLGFTYQVGQWYEAAAPLPNHRTDLDPEIESAIQQVRWILSDGEQERLRALGRDTAAALEEAAAGVRAGDSEFEIAARLDAAARKRGGVALVNLIATDERISQYRHPLPTHKTLDKVAMLVVCVRRHGLIVSGTRFVTIGSASTELRDKLSRIAAIDSALLAATRPGRTLGDAFADLQAAYAAQGEADQWKLHHQGGLGGHVARERVATPDDPTPMQVGQCFAWNPSIVGAKSEDTALLTADGIEVVTPCSAGYPTIEVALAGTTYVRAGILEL
jgi:antitoxin VapB